ncbi:glycerol uptake facilitator protein [Hoyosella altamirensis]|uniref:Glycerol uptake facilitator protein n=1 Tax=Hoyosella altamirensis TaxID=616997 RepID=A0A839RQW9_9ACTN|nr:glycerol uptake facilitator protein [Hoyosella altamirensis]
MDSLTIPQVLIFEALGTGLLVLLGTGVVATVVLKHSKGAGGGWLLINLGWAMAVFAGASVAWKSGAHINPAVTFGLAVSGRTNWDLVPFYVCAQLVGAFIGATLCWLAFKKNFDVEPEPGKTLGIFSTGPAVRSYGWNTVTEVIGTFVLVLWILLAASDPAGNSLGYAAVAFVVLGLGASLGGPTGYAINPARDLGPRLAYALLPIRGKSGADWAYSWVPIAGPIAGSFLAGMLYVGIAGYLV